LRYLPWIQPVLARDEARAAQLVAWLAPELRDTSAYRAALLESWPQVPSTLVEKSRALREQFAAFRLQLESPLPPSDATAPTTQPLPSADSFLFDPPTLLPTWFRDHCPDAFVPPHLDALLARAPLWVRLQVADETLV